MSSNLRRDLKKRRRHLVQLVRRGAGMSNVFGFIIDSTEDWVLVHHFDSEAFCLTGYDVLRMRDIRSYAFFDNSRYWRFRALHRLKIRPAAPIGISLASIPELLASVSERYPLLSVHHEKRDRTMTFVGPIVSMGQKTFAIKDSNYYGEWTGPRRMRYNDVTRVCFDGGYLRASALACQPTGKGKRLPC